MDKLKIKSLSLDEYFNFLRLEGYTTLLSPSFKREFTKVFPRINISKMFLYLYAKYREPLFLESTETFLSSLYRYCFEISFQGEFFYIFLDIKSKKMEKDSFLLYVPYKYVKKDFKARERLYKKYFEEMTKKNIPVVVDTYFLFSYKKYFPFSEKVFEKNLKNVFRLFVTEDEYKIIYDNFSSSDLSLLTEEEKKRRRKGLKLIERLTDYSKTLIEEDNKEAALVLFDRQEESFPISKYPKIEEVVNLFFEELKKPFKVNDETVLKLC